MKLITLRFILSLFIVSPFSATTQNGWAADFLVPLFDAHTDQSLAEKSRLATQLYPEDSRLTVQVRIEKAGAITSKRFYDRHASELKSLLEDQAKKGRVLEVRVGVDSEDSSKLLSSQSLPDRAQLRCVKRMLFDDFY
jgi:hypothetical protein